MKIDRSFISTQNTYEENDPRCIVVHNTDNFRVGADARTHAEAQHNGELSNMSAHYYVDDGDTAYQAAPHNRGCWHVGVNYGGANLFGRYGNRSSIGVEMCVQSGYDYEKAFRNTVAVVKEIMRETGIPASMVYRHYDICSKHCPSQIMERDDWGRFKKLISGASNTPKQPENTKYEPGIYKVNDAALNIRKRPNVDSEIVGVIRDKGSYTVTEIQNTSWGRLLSGAGLTAILSIALMAAQLRKRSRNRPQKRSQLMAYGVRSLPAACRRSSGPAWTGKSVTSPRQTRNTASVSQRPSGAIICPADQL